jgi:hypothetical protein
MTAINHQGIEPRALRLDSPLLKPEQAAEPCTRLRAR